MDLRVGEGGSKVPKLIGYVQSEGKRFGLRERPKRGKRRADIGLGKPRDVI